MTGISPSFLTRGGYIKSVRPSSKPAAVQGSFLLSRTWADTWLCRVCFQGNHSSKPHVSGNSREELRCGPITKESAGLCKLFTVPTHIMTLVVL